MPVIIETEIKIRFDLQCILRRSILQFGRRWIDCFLFSDLSRTCIHTNRHQRCGGVSSLQKIIWGHNWGSWGRHLGCHSKLSSAMMRHHHSFEAWLFDCAWEWDRQTRTNYFSEIDWPPTLSPTYVFL